jgi:hypothetical protein
VQENSTMIEKDVNPSCVFFIDVNEPFFFVEALSGEDSQHWKKPRISGFSLYKTIKFE